MCHSVAQHRKAHPRRSRRATPAPTRPPHPRPALSPSDGAPPGQPPRHEGRQPRTQPETPACNAGRGPHSTAASSTARGIADTCSTRTAARTRGRRLRAADRRGGAAGRRLFVNTLALLSDRSSGPTPRHGPPKERRGRAPERRRQRRPRGSTTAEALRGPCLPCLFRPANEEERERGVRDAPEERGVTDPLLPFDLQTATRRREVDCHCPPPSSFPPRPSLHAFSLPQKTAMLWVDEYRCEGRLSVTGSARPPAALFSHTACRRPNQTEPNQTKPNQTALACRTARGRWTS